MKSDCYDVLGVAPTASKREIQKEYCTIVAIYFQGGGRACVRFPVQTVAQIA